MLRDGSPIGAISVAGAEPAMFSERQIAMLQTFADQAVIAIENTRLFNELQTRNRDLTEALEQQTATSEILRVISQSQRDVQPVFETIAANARKLCDADLGMRSSPFDGDLIRIAAADSVSPEALEAIRERLPDAARAAVTLRRPRRSHAKLSFTSRTFASDAGVSLGRVVARRSDFAACFRVPMLRDGSADRSDHASPAPRPAHVLRKQIAMLQTFADQAVIAIENTRLFNELQTRNRDLTESLEQQTATSEILRVISQSQRDVQPVFETIAANARKLCEVTFAAVLTVRWRARQRRGCSTASVRKCSRRCIESTRWPPSRGGASGRAILTRAVVYVPMFARIRNISLQEPGSGSRISQRRRRAYAPRRQPNRSDQRQSAPNPRCSPKGRSRCCRPSPTKR